MSVIVQNIAKKELIKQWKLIPTNMLLVLYNTNKDELDNKNSFGWPLLDWLKLEYNRGNLSYIVYKVTSLNLIQDLFETYVESRLRKSFIWKHISR